MISNFKWSVLLSLAFFMTINAIFLSGCSDRDSESKREVMPAPDLVHLKKDTHGISLEFRELDTSFTGQAQGLRLFQEVGPLNQVLSRLLAPARVTVTGEGSSRRSFRLHLTWTEEHTWEAVQDSVLQLLTSALNAEVHRSEENVQVFRLSSLDRSQLSQTAQPGRSAEGVTSTTLKTSSSMEVIGSLSYLADQISSVLEKPVFYAGDDANLYNFRFSLTNLPESLQQTLRETYGLSLESDQQVLPHFHIKL